MPQDCPEFSHRIPGEAIGSVYGIAPILVAARAGSVMFPGVDTREIIGGLISYACLVPVIACHEFAHAWVADKCGDDTPRSQGRVTLNPLAHMELVGTLILPLLSIYLGGFMFGWGKPVYVNPGNFRNRRVDDTLVSLAGPAMNLAMAVALMVLAKISSIAGLEVLTSACIQVTTISLLLGFFNLLPIPPLDGSHVVKNLIHMREETYFGMCQYGFLLVIIAVQIPFVSWMIQFATVKSLSMMAAAVNLHV